MSEYHSSIRLSSRSVQVAQVLDRLAVSRSLPQVIRTDNDKEFCGKVVVASVHERAVQLRLIQPGKPNQNAYIESFNGRFRGECLNEHWFPTLLHARTKLKPGGGTTTRNNRRRS
ncbi:transposase InsO family protein [Xanthomonas sacchari]|nr:transposase InsO family protein [Xanthomonas sacchari]